MAEHTTTNAGFKYYDDGDSAATGVNWNEGYNENWQQLDGMAGDGLAWDASTPPKLAVQVDGTTIEISGNELRVVDGLLLTRIQFAALSAAPSSPITGLMCLADRTNWDPLSKGSGGPYFVWYNGSDWVAIGNQ